MLPPDFLQRVERDLTADSLLPDPVKELVREKALKLWQSEEEMMNDEVRTSRLQGSS